MQPAPAIGAGRSHPSLTIAPGCPIVAAVTDPETPAEAPAEPARPRRAASPEELIRTCPNCGRALEERRCKLFCPDPRCGFFLSCAEYY